MKRTIIYLFGALMLWSANTEAQTAFRQKVQGDASTLKVEITNLASELNIVGHSSDEIVIEADKYKGIPEKAKGLKPLSAYGEDNTSVGLYFNQKGNVVEISGASRASSDADYTIRIPAAMKVKIDSDDWNAEDIQVSGMQNEVEIKANSSDIDVEDVTGPVVLNALNGEITVSFSRLDQEGPSSITATNGDVEINLPSGSKADFKLSCLNGEIYTNMDISLDEKSESGLRRIGGGMKANGQANGGGIEFSVHALNGNVYLRGK